MREQDIVNFVVLNRNSGISYQEIIDDIAVIGNIVLSKPAAMRIYKTHKVGKEIAKTLNLEPSAKILRDRERRKEQRAEFVRLREKNKLWFAWYSRLQNAAGCVGSSWDETIDIIHNMKTEKDKTS